LFLFPLLVQRPLVIGEQGIDLPVGALLDGPAATGFVVAVARRVVAKTIDGDVPVDEDHLQLEDLVLCQMELFFEIFHLAGGLPGRGNFLLCGWWKSSVCDGLSMGQGAGSDTNKG